MTRSAEFPDNHQGNDQLKPLSDELKQSLQQVCAELSSLLQQFGASQHDRQRLRINRRRIKDKMSELHQVIVAASEARHRSGPLVDTAKNIYARAQYFLKRSSQQKSS